MMSLANSSMIALRETLPIRVDLIIKNGCFNILFIDIIDKIILSNSNKFL